MEPAKTPAPDQKKKLPWLKRIGIVLLIAFIGIQFMQPNKNNTNVGMSNDIAQVVTIPDTVHQLLKTACYNCHSNYTNYPWYSNIQPLGWWLANHIEEGKSKLNFQEFALVTPNQRFTTVKARQIHKLEEVAETQVDKWMPMKSYTLIHADAKLTDAQRKLIITWVDSAKLQLSKP